jgi:hypothetical protein
MKEPMTADIDKERAVMEIKKTWMHELHGIMNSPRVAEMTFHVPKVDKDMEFITPGAMAGALKDYMKFPIISEFHKERPIGIAEKVWQTKDDEFKATIRIRDDPSTDDVWEKMNLPEGTPGRYDQVSIAGKRIVYSQECNMPLGMRKASNPCRTEKLRLDSVSVCDDRARNDGTELNVVKALSDGLETFVYTTSLELTKVEDTLIKAETTESELIHPVTDGASQPDKLKKDHPATGTNTVKGGTMKKCNDPKVKKTSEEEGQEPVEETEAKKGEEEKDTNPEKQVEKAPPEVEEKEEAKKAEDPYQEILKLLRELISSDKKVHKEVEKAEEKPADKKEEKEEKMEEKKVEKAEIPASDEDNKLIKAQMEQDFKKALDAAIAPLQLQLTALAAEVQKIGDEPLLKAGIYLKELQIDKDGKPELGNAGMLAAQRSKTAGKK